MSLLMVGLTILLLVVRSMMMKAASDREAGLPQMLVIFGTAAVTSAIIAALRGFHLHSSTVAIALSFGLCNFLSQYLNILAMGRGIASRVVFVVSCNFLVSTIYSISVFQESITIFRITGILLTCAAQLVFCFGGRHGRRDETVGRSWLFYAVAAMFFSGVVGIIQKYMQLSAYPSELAEMSTLAASTSFVTAALLLSIRGQWRSFSRMKEKRGILTFSLLLGLVATTINIVSTYAHRFVDGSVAFPVFNGGSLVLTILSAHLIFRDRLSTKEKWSVFIGITAITVLGL